MKRLLLIVALPIVAAAQTVIGIPGSVSGSAVSSLSVTPGKTPTFTNTLTFSGTDGSTINFGAGGTIGSIGYSALGQLAGTATNDDATAGNVGQFLSSDVASASAVSLTNNSWANVTSITLTAGDWEVWGVVSFTQGSGTTTTVFVVGIGTTSAAAPPSPYQYGAGGQQTSTSADFSITCPSRRFSVAGSTPVYLVALSSFSVSTLKAYGFIHARRIR